MSKDHARCPFILYHVLAVVISIYSFIDSFFHSSQRFFYFLSLVEYGPNKMLQYLIYLFIHPHNSFISCNQLKMVLIKCCDISNEVRPMNISEPWVDCLLEEYFMQSDREKAEGLPVAPFMDR